jgi:hypothetical protein
MGRIEWGDSEEADLALIKSHVQRFADILMDNGKEGLVTRFNNYITAFTVLEEEREKQHKANVNRLNVIIAILSALAAYIAIIITMHGGPKPVSANPLQTSTEQVATTQTAGGTEHVHF